MPPLRECYRILGLSPRAELTEIKRRFRLLALKFHPDRNPQNPEAVSRFREVAEAYGAICQRRRRHPAPAPQAPESGTSAPPPFNREEVAAYFGGDVLAGLPSFSGPDFRYDLQISFLAAMQGLEKDLAIRRLVPCRVCQATGMQPGTYFQDCPDCQGRGRLWRSPGQLKIGASCHTCQGHGKILAHPCSRCGGQGYHLEWKNYRVVIPPGVEHLARISIPGEGGDGFQKGSPGCLVVVVHVEPHSFFTRNNNDLHGAVEVSFAQAMLGDTIEVPTLAGPRFLELPRGVRSGTSFHFPGLGVPANGNGPDGNLVITIHIVNSTRCPEPAGENGLRRRGWERR